MQVRRPDRQKYLHGRVRGEVSARSRASIVNEPLDPAINRGFT